MSRYDLALGKIDEVIRKETLKTVRGLIAERKAMERGYDLRNLLPPVDEAVDRAIDAHFAQRRLRPVKLKPQWPPFETIREDMI